MDKSLESNPGSDKHHKCRLGNYKKLGRKLIRHRSYRHLIYMSIRIPEKQPAKNSPRSPSDKRLEYNCKLSDQKLCFPYNSRHSGYMNIGSREAQVVRFAWEGRVDTCWSKGLVCIHSPKKNSLDYIPSDILLRRFVAEF